MLERGKGFNYYILKEETLIHCSDPPPPLTQPEKPGSYPTILLSVEQLEACLCLLTGRGYYNKGLVSTIIFQSLFYRVKKVI